MSSAEGRNNPSTPDFASFSTSASSGRGYLDKSSFGANCVGFTKIEAYTGEHSFLALPTSARCPACSAPIVGTRPITRCSSRASRAFCFIQEIVRIVSMPEARLSLRRGHSLAIKQNQIRPHAFRPQLPQHCGYLSAVIASVIHRVL